MIYLSVTLILGGSTAVVWGLPAAHRLRRPFDIMAALLALIGMIAALMGVLLTAVPGFFHN